ncbi:MAG TPA: YihY/virulence factor BrkB family protein [Longimicrobiales bacterium]|nr:YihY/virulence factor BrkB family protein [Longimicrobiales bacterium]
MLDLLKTTFREFAEDDAPRMAAALSYYTIFSLPPLLILLLTIAGVFLEPQDIQGRVLEETQAAVGASGAEQIRTMIEQAERPGSGGTLRTILSIAALLFGATGAFAQLQAALNKAWEVEKSPDRSGVVKLVLKRVLSLGMILVIAFLLLVSLILSAVLSRMGDQVASYLPDPLGQAGLMALDVGLSLLVITTLFAAMFKVLPDAKVAWRDVWLGAGVTAGLFIVGKYLLSFYISQASPGSAFGAAGSLAILLVWVYYSAMILFLGAEFTEAWAERRGRAIVPDKGAVRVAEG